MKTFKEHLAESSFDPNKKKHPLGGTVGTLVDNFNKDENGRPRLIIFFSANHDPSKMRRGRRKTHEISYHYDPAEAEEAKNAFAKKWGYQALRKIGEDVEVQD